MCWRFTACPYPQKDRSSSNQLWCQQTHFVLGIKAEGISVKSEEMVPFLHAPRTWAVNNVILEFSDSKKQGWQSLLSQGWWQEQLEVHFQKQTWLHPQWDHAVPHVSISRSSGTGLRDVGFHFLITLHQSQKFGLLHYLLMLSRLLNKNKLG